MIKRASRFSEERTTQEVNFERGGSWSRGTLWEIKLPQCPCCGAEAGVQGEVFVRPASGKNESQSDTDSHFPNCCKDAV